MKFPKLTATISNFVENLYLNTTATQMPAVVQGRKNPLWQGLPERLRRTRKRAGLSQRHVARLASFSETTLHFVESGTRATIDTVERLAAALGVPAGWLAFGPEAHLPFRQVQSLPESAYADPAPNPGAGVFRGRYKPCGERVRQVREDLGLTLKEVAEAAALSEQAVLNTEYGATVPRLDSLEAIAVALDVAPAWLAYGDDDDDEDRSA